MNRSVRSLGPLVSLLCTVAACDPGGAEPSPPCASDPLDPPVAAAPGVVVPDGFEAVEVVVGGGLHRIAGMALGPDGHLFVSDIGDLDTPGDEAIFEVDPETGHIETIVSGLPLGTPGRMVFGDGRPPLGEDLIVADWNSEVDDDCCGGRIFAVDVETGTVTPIAEASASLATGDPFGIALASGGFPGSVYVQDFQGASPQTPVLMRIDADSSTHDVVVDPIQWTINNAPRHIVFGEGHGYHGMYVFDSAPGRIWHVDSDFNLTSFVEGPPVGTPSTARFGLGDAFGHAMYVLSSSSKDLFTIAPDGTPGPFGSIDDADGFADMVFAPGCGTLYVGTENRIIAIRPVS